jgi:lysophospholipase L1-like esterase
MLMTDFSAPFNVHNARGLRRTAAAVTLAVLASVLPAHTIAADAPAAVASPASRWQSSLEEFAAADKAKKPLGRGVLFVGSSTIRMWTTMVADFRDVPIIINRGYGGSTLEDSSHMVRQLVTQYQPSHVLVYAGENDLQEGRTPAQVLASMKRLVGGVRAELPGARITFISIKPSPSRATILPAVRASNALIQEYLLSQYNADYIDVFTPMVGPDGKLRAELFLPDMLHMNAAGYDLWHRIIAPYVVQDMTP